MIPGKLLCPMSRPLVLRSSVVRNELFYGRASRVSKGKQWPGKSRGVHGRSANASPRISFARKLGAGVAVPGWRSATPGNRGKGVRCFENTIRSIRIVITGKGRPEPEKPIDFVTVTREQQSDLSYRHDFPAARRKPSHSSPPNTRAFAPQ